VGGLARVSNSARIAFVLQYSGALVRRRWQDSPHPALHNRASRPADLLITSAEKNSRPGAGAALLQISNGEHHRDTSFGVARPAIKGPPFPRLK
jgi:hypothetical protein